MTKQEDIILITGAGSGMGRLAAEQAAREGKQVVGFDLNEQALKEIESEYRNITTYAVDITDYQRVESIINNIATNKGKIKRVINCAGIMPLGTLNSQHASQIKTIMDVNYIGTVNVNKAALEHMLKEKDGEIINFASIAGWSPTIAFGAYNAAKFAVVAFSEVLHHENRHNGIKVCCVCPPPVNTPLFQNAVNRPKSLDIAPTVEPAFILNEMEKSIKKGDAFCIPGWKAKAAYYIRRFTPNLLWEVIHIAEGKNLDHLSLPLIPKRRSAPVQATPLRKVY